jgi:hypothetical protein
MKPTVRRSMMFAALFVACAAGAQPAPPHPPRADRHGDRPPVYVEDGFRARLRQLLQESRDKRSRVVLRSDGEEVAGVVQDLGPDWVILSNQDEQQILLRLQTVERAEIR